MGIKLITNPSLFVNHKIGWLEKVNFFKKLHIISINSKTNEKYIHNNNSSQQKDSLDAGDEVHIAKQPDDLIILRQLKFVIK